MEENKTWQVFITNQLGDDLDRNQVVSKLAALFKTDSSKAEQLLSRPKTLVKEQIDKATAQKYFNAISKAGAHCEIINTADAELPQIFEPVIPDTKAASEGLIRQPAAQKRLSTEPALAMIEKEKQEEKKTREKLAAYQNVDASFYCPECGTIRSSADAACLHCGYDPSVQARDRSGIKRMAYIAVVLLIVIAAAGYFGMPFYQQYARKSSIQEGLQLAIDTRNHITQFILKTGFWPNQNIDAELPKHISNDIIASIVVTGNGAFTVTLQEQVLGKTGQTIIFKPNKLQGKLVWNCSGGTLDNEYRPEICQTR